PDRVLCDTLVSCMRRTSCWVKDPQQCYCVTAAGETCTTPAANGPCWMEVQAATKTTTAADTVPRFYDTLYPADHALQMLACDPDFCATECLSVPQTASSGGPVPSQ